MQSCRHALQAGGPDARTCFNLANALRETGLRREAAERYLQALELDPGYAAAWVNLGVTPSELGKTDDAYHALAAALELDPEHPEGNWAMANVLEEMGWASDAADHWRAYLRHDHTSEWAAYARQQTTPP